MTTNKCTCLMVGLALLLLTMTNLTFAQTPFTLENRSAAQRADRYGNLPLGAVIRTDERYGSDPLFQGPRGWEYWNQLQSPKGYQNPNVWPDKRPTYFVAQVKMSTGSRLTLRGRFPHARYFKYALYRFEHKTFVALGGEDVAGWDVEPDEGSSNPYIVGADRSAENRNYTVHVVADEAPKNRVDRAKNTLYAGRKEEVFQIVIRVYVSDDGFDGAGLARADGPSSSGPLLTYDGALADGTRLDAGQVAERFGQPMSTAQPLMPADPWYALVNSKENDPKLTPATAPARENSRWEVFRGMKYTVAGAFQAPEQQAKIKLTSEAEAGADPTTVYLMSFLSSKFAPIYVFRGKMPTFPDTYAGGKTMSDGQVVYWSVGTMGAPPSGQLWDGVFDMMVPLDKDGYYTIVVSRPEDRPENATRENGVAWIDWGPGEGSNDPRDRKDWGMLLMRFMVCDPSWETSPAKARKPGTLETTMGPYYPKGHYTTKAAFETKGSAVAQARKVTAITVTDTRDMRFGEILVVKKDVAEVYNTTGLNDCPAESWDAMNTEELARENGALRIQQNGPKYWMMDSQTLMLGEKASFDGVEGRWAAALPTHLLGKDGAVPYQVFNPRKTQRMVYRKGKPVYELVDPEGHAYALQARYERFSIESLPKLGDQMKKLPKGWKYRTRILTEDLVLDLTPDETIYGVGDEFHQYYMRIPKTQ
jgi:hypothetical protein